MDARIVGSRQRVDDVEAKALSEPIASDDQLKAYVAQFLCVLSSGLLEDAIRLILIGYANKQSNVRVASYVASRLSDFQNPKFEKILTLLGSFDQAWRRHFEDASFMEIKDAIDSIVNNRNQIAHGGQVGISLISFGRYYSQLKMFIVELDELVGEVKVVL